VFSLDIVPRAIHIFVRSIASCYGSVKMIRFSYSNEDTKDEEGKESPQRGRTRSRCSAPSPWERATSGPRYWKGALEGEGRGSARLVALEGEDQGMRLWRILASRGIVKARNAQTRPFSLFCLLL
jgi:hypothetical protein